VSDYISISVIDIKVDHLGNRYKNFTGMCRHYGKTLKLVAKRMSYGATLEEALTTDKRKGDSSRKPRGPNKRRNTDRQNQYKDHTGAEFKSFYWMCKHHGKSCGYVRGLLKQGMTLERALLSKGSIPQKQRRTRTYRKNGVKYSGVDPTGKDHLSFRALCGAYEISEDTVRARLDRGMSVEEALTKPIDKVRTGNAPPSQIFSEAFGSKFGTWKEVEEHYGLLKQTLKDRIKTGIPLDVPADTIMPCKDHLGNEYNNKADMCKAYGITYSNLSGRLDAGWSLEESLTRPIRQDYTKRTVTCVDHIGQRFPSLAARGRYYGLSPGVIRERLQYGWTLEEALTRPKQKMTNGMVQIKNRMASKNGVGNE
jgi:hypothetical protein